MLAAAAASLPRGDPPWDRSRELWALAGLALALLVAVVLQGRVLSGTPVPGNDWAKYLLYADEIARQGSLLIDNPLWMLGVPFREDPGAPSLYGSFLVLTGAPAGVLMHGIWVFALASLLSVFAFVRALWGSAAACCAARAVGGAAHQPRHPGLARAGQCRGDRLDAAPPPVPGRAAHRGSASGGRQPGSRW